MGISLQIKVLVVLVQVIRGCSRDDCLAAAHEAGEGLNLPTWLNKFDWAGLPCGCFLWHNTNGSILVDYNTATTSCNPNAHTQMVCKSSAPPTPPSPTLKPTLAPTKSPTSSPTKAPTKSPTAAPTKVPTVAAPTEAPTPTPPTSSPAYFLADKSVGGTCPSGSEDVPESDCLAAAHEAGEGLNLPTWLNNFDWAGLPCGCFLLHNTNGSILLDYNTATTSCNPNAFTQMVCKSL